MSDDKKEEMKRVVIEALTEEFKKPSGHEEITAFAKGLEEGKEMELKVLTGGLCNFSYKLSFKDSDDAVLFVKLTFGTPVAFPDVPCSPDRTMYEFKAMELFAKATPYPETAVKPYLIFDVEGSEENMKIIVTEFSSRLEEQAANVFVDGDSVDKNFAIKIAKSISALHNTEVTELDFNEGMKEFFLTMSGICNMLFAGYLDESNEKPDRVATKGREIGKDALDEIMETMGDFLVRTDCYVHGDCHMFNMLVEETLKAAANEDENAVGDVAIIDWEFAHCGPMGKDLGWVQVFPVACALTHAINGDMSNVDSIVAFLNSCWETYEADINLEFKFLSKEDLYRQVLASLGIMLIAYSGLGIHCEYLPVEEGNEKDLEKIKESLGVLALEFFEIGFRGKHEDASLEELRKCFTDALQAEIDLLKPPTRKVSFRRSSVLRTTRKRVSDAHSYFSMATESDLAKELDGDEASDEFNFDTSDEFRQIYFGSFDSDNPRASIMNSRRSKRISVMPRISLAITDLKRKSIGQWDQMIQDWDF